MAWTYTSLLEATTAFLDGFTDVDFASIFPVCVRQAEERILHVTKVQPFRRLESVIAAPGSAVIGQFPELMVPISVSSAYTPMLNKERNWIDEVFGENTVTGDPAYYAIQQQLNDQTITEIVVAPPAPGPQVYRVEYMAKPPSLVTEQNGTWISTNCENALFYGVLFYVYGGYEKGEADLVNSYKEEFEKALSLLKGMTRTGMRRDDFRASPQAQPEG